MGSRAKRLLFSCGSVIMIPGDGMKTFKHFIGYYKPYKFVFFFDLFCALTISLIDLAFPLILNYCTDTMFIQKSVEILQGLVWLTAGLLVLYIYSSFMSLLCISTRSYHGCTDGKRYAKRII